MQLDVIPGDRSRESLWGLFLDIEYDWACAVGEELVLDSAQLVCNRSLKTLWDANRAFLSGQREDAEAWVDAVQRESAVHGLRPLVWDIERVEPAAREALRQALLGRGFREQFNPVQRLTHWQRQANPPELGVIPARSARELYCQLCREWVTADRHEADLVTSMMLHLEDPKFEPLLVLRDGRPIAMAGLQSRGEAGRVEDVFVTPDCRGQGVGHGIVDHVLELAARAQLRNVFVVSSPLNAQARSFYTRIGFEPLQNYAVWVAPDA